jgi:hypothetical protein
VDACKAGELLYGFHQIKLIVTHSIWHPRKVRFSISRHESKHGKDYLHRPGNYLLVAQQNDALAIKRIVIGVFGNDGVDDDLIGRQTLFNDADRSGCSGCALLFTRFAGASRAW